MSMLLDIHCLVIRGIRTKKMLRLPRLHGQTLHAMVLGFQHPLSGEYMEFTAPLPEYFQKLLLKF